MKDTCCRICGEDLLVYEDLEDVPIEVNTVYEEPFSMKKNSKRFYLCPKCHHGQLFGDIDENHYLQYNLLNIGQVPLHGGGNAGLRDEYYHQVIQRLINYFVSNGTEHPKLLDIGCGHGTVMKIAQRLSIEIEGVEPSKIESDIAKSQGLIVHNTFFDENFISNKRYDGFVMSQVLEHIDDVSGFMKNAYICLNNKGYGYIDVPNGEKIIEDCRYYDVYAEHINYFSVNSLVKVVSDAGFSVRYVEKIRNENHIAIFVQKIEKTLQFNKKRINDIEKVRLISRDKKAAIWGGGVKGRLFAKNLFPLENIKYIFDGDSKLWGKYIEGTKMIISRPDTEKLNEIEILIISAIEYKDEISNELIRKYNYDGEIIGIDMF